MADRKSELETADINEHLRNMVGILAALYTIEQQRQAETTPAGWTPYSVTMLPGIVQQILPRKLNRASFTLVNPSTTQTFWLSNMFFNESEIASQIGSPYVPVKVFAMPPGSLPIVVATTDSLWGCVASGGAQASLSIIESTFASGLVRKVGDRENVHDVWKDAKHVMVGGDSIEMAGLV